MTWIDIIILVILGLSFIGGLREGGGKQLFGLVSILVAIPLAGALYTWPMGWLSPYMPPVWAGFTAYFATSGIIGAVISGMMIWPRRSVETAWRHGAGFRLMGGLMNVIGSAIGLVVFYLLLRVYPVFDWLIAMVNSSDMMQWLVVRLPFVQDLLPQAFRLPAGVFSWLGGWG